MNRHWLLPILTVVMGLQLLRVFIPSLAWYMRDTVGLSSLSLAPYAAGTFLIAFLAAPLRRLVGPRSALRVTAIGVAAARVAEQLSTDPAIDLWLSIGGMALFLLFLPIYLGHLRARGGSAAAYWGFGLPLGLAVDIGLHGATGTLDLSWVGGLLPLLVVLVIAALGAWSAWTAEPGKGDSEAHWGAVLPLIGIGPFLLLQLLVLQSSGWVEEVAGIGLPALGRSSLAAQGQPPAAAWLAAAGPRLPLGWSVVMLGNLALVFGVRQGLQTSSPRVRLLTIGATVYLTLAAYYATTPGLPFIFSLILTQLVLGWGWGVVSRRAAEAVRPSLRRTGIALPLGTLLFLALAFAYYVALNIALPFPRAAVLPAAAALFGLSALAAASSHNLAPAAGLPLRLAAALLLVPWVAALARGPAPRPASGAAPLRIMTYNIHSSFGAAGRHDPEAIAQVIERSGADVIALQEVSRVRLLDGGTDLAGWLSRRLGMPVVFRGAEEPIWGNAILSRYPMVRSGWADLPREGALIGRGYIWAEIDAGFPLLVINAHLHHIETDNHIRLAEVPVLLEFWDQRPHTVLLGDLNAEPHYPEMALPAQAGLIDAWGAAGSGVGFTWSAADPIKRIDWIWTTPDLQASEIEVVATLASDHLPVIAEIQPAP